MTRVLVCGGREYSDRKTLETFLEMYDLSRNFTDLCHGAAPGADTLAGEWARKQGHITVYPYPAQWIKDGKRDRAAGPIRNKKMLDEFKPELVIAFKGGRGTAHMVRIARAAGVEVIEIPQDNDPPRPLSSAELVKLRLDEARGVSDGKA